MAISLHGSELNISGDYGLAGAATGLANGGFALSYLVFTTSLYAYDLVVYNGLSNLTAGPKNLGTPNGGTSSGNGDIAELANHRLAVTFLESGPARAIP